jgi:hypothetical protein
VTAVFAGAAHQLWLGSLSPHVKDLQTALAAFCTLLALCGLYLVFAPLLHLWPHHPLPPSTEASAPPAEAFAVSIKKVEWIETPNSMRVKATIKVKNRRDKRTRLAKTSVRMADLENDNTVDFVAPPPEPGERRGPPLLSQGIKRHLSWDETLTFPRQIEGSRPVLVVEVTDEFGKSYKAVWPRYDDDRQRAEIVGGGAWADIFAGQSRMITRFRPHRHRPEGPS